MNKIIVVGHPQSGFEGVSGLLMECGMSEALPSRREHLTPVQITEILCKAHGVSLLEQVGSANQLKQIEVAPVWQNIAFDLLLGNIDQPLWGWADSQIIYFLDYWKALDPRIVFVLIYDSPETVLSHVADEFSHESDQALQQKVDVWTAYNSALLHFYLRNTERCILVHSQQVHHSIHSYLQQIRKRINVPLHEPILLEKQRERRKSRNSTNEPLDIEKVKHILLASNRADRQPENLLTKHLVRNLLQNYPNALNLYDELQASANLPFVAQQNNASSISSISIYKIWCQILTQQRNSIEQLNDEIKQYKTNYVTLESENITLKQMSEKVEQENKLVQTQFFVVQEELENYYHYSRKDRKELQKFIVKVEELQLEKAELNKQCDDVIKAYNDAVKFKEDLNKQITILKQSSDKTLQENKLLRTQLFVVQEELEKHYLGNEKKQEKLEELQLKKIESDKRCDDAIKAYKDIVDFKEKLDKQIVILKQSSDKTLQENKILQAQLFVVQEELEKYYLRNQKERKTLDEFKIRVEELQLEKVESDKQRDDAIKSRDGLDRQTFVLRQSTDKVIQENKLLQTQLFVVQEELENYYFKNHNDKLKDEGIRKDIKAEKFMPALYGAPDRVKQQLSYQLGSAAIQQSRSFTGWLMMIFVLFSVLRNFRQQQSVRKKQKLPPLHRYRDITEAEKIKKHLSYRLGGVLIRYGRNPLLWIMLPFAVIKEVNDFRSSKKINK